jgi:hypothetical protein
LKKKGRASVAPQACALGYHIGITPSALGTDSPQTLSWSLTYAPSPLVPMGAPVGTFFGTGSLAAGGCRHGHLPEREMVTGIGPVAVRCARVRDRAADPLSPLSLLSASTVLE